MARKYRRKSNGQFAGGAGQSNGRSTNSGASVGGNGSKGRKAAKPKLTAGARFKKGAKASAKFAVHNPRLVLGVAAVGLHVGANASMKASHKRSIKAGQMNQRRKTDFIAAKRGLGSNKPGSGLKIAKRTLRGAYKIASK